MKNLISTFMFFGTLSLTGIVNAQIYKQPDICGEYIKGCRSVVEKCRFTGTAYCVISDQVPCEEACQIA
ncbi:hypothetical protein V8V91_20955 [Algoriphagus halophilus]|uniref:hypothetical protein n=1 Tax=Algoriphagus halophilus TaxID=226505 RepID=UPI00358E9AE8